MYMAVPCPVLTLCKHTPHPLLDKRRVFLKIENGERGEAVLAEAVGCPVVATVATWQLKPGTEAGSAGVRGVAGLLLEKNLVLMQLVGIGDELWFRNFSSSCCCFC